jgi:hypothetical protein
MPLADPSRDELHKLRTEVENQDGTILGHGENLAGKT